MRRETGQGAQKNYSAKVNLMIKLGILIFFIRFTRFIQTRSANNIAFCISTTLLS